MNEIYSGFIVISLNFDAKIGTFGKNIKKGKRNLQSNFIEILDLKSIDRKQIEKIKGCQRVII